MRRSPRAGVILDAPQARPEFNEGLPPSFRGARSANRANRALEPLIARLASASLRAGARMARHDFIAVYLMASRRNGTLYLGVTSDLLARAAQHRSGAFKGFAAKYGCTRLVWFERGADMPTAIAREKELKRWRRGWKLALIEADNPQWLDLYEDFLVPRDGRRPELED